MNTRMDRTKLNIGTYILQPYARTEEHIKDLADCGIDFVVCMGNDRPALDLFAKYGVGAIVSGIVPGWWGGDGSNAGKFAATNPLSKYEKAAADFVDHPAIWGIDTGDEPSALDFPHYGKVEELTNKLFPNQFAYLNLYPNYASIAQNNGEETVNQLGTKTYAEHVEEYCKHVGLDYICYDFYMYSTNMNAFGTKDSFLGRMLDNYRVIADNCLKNGRSMWFIPQVNSLHKNLWLSENMLRFQAYSSLAYGAEVIEWACWTAGWWENQVVDSDGKKTEQYDKLKKINAELKGIGEEYMKYRRTATHAVGFDKEMLSCYDGEVVDSFSTGVFTNVSAGGDELLAGQMVSRANDGTYALMLCAADDPFDFAPKTITVTFTAFGKKIRALNGCGAVEVKALGEDKYSVDIPSCGGVLVVAE